MFDPFFKRAAPVTCSDSVGFLVCRGLSVATAGSYTVLLQGDTVAVAMNLAAGVIHKLAAKRVNSTGAAATVGVVAFY
jgi:hypothetical protein